ncbi:MAG: metallophosphoesterase [Eubacteriales bacterium]|nr:metallophosphoesterase [Eubacteriales bacterium]
MIILHLTDIHADIHNPENFLFRFECMLKALSGLPSDWKPDVITLTGDFGYHGIRQEFQLSEACIQMLFKETKLSGAQTIACEGNHDGEYTGSRNSFKEYKNFLTRMGIECHSLCIDGISIFSLNTCTQTTPALCDHAVLVPELSLTLPENSVLIMHHPPYLINPLPSMKTMVKNCSLILSGHIHPNSPYVSHFGNALSENGCAFTPASPESFWGCQLIRYQKNLPLSTIEVGSLITASMEKPDFQFFVKEYSFL